MVTLAPKLRVLVQVVISDTLVAQKGGNEMLVLIVSHDTFATFSSVCFRTVCVCVQGPKFSAVSRAGPPQYKCTSLRDVECACYDFVSDCGKMRMSYFYRFVYHALEVLTLVHNRIFS